MFGQGASMFSMALLDFVKDYTNIRVLSSDMSTPAGLDKFKSVHPDMFINVGIAEQNMIGIAAGLTEEGYRPICVAQACFLSMRSFEQIRQYAGYMKLPIIFVGIGSGYSLSLMGNTHYAMEDVALMRTIPNMQIIAPCDAYEAVKALEAAIKSDKPTYIRLFGGTGLPIIFNEEPIFEIGKAISLKEGKDVQLIATGSMVSIAMRVALELENEGLSVSVVDMHTIKPLDETILDKQAKMIVTIEEHSIIGGLGSAISDFLANMSKHPILLKIGSKDKFSKVGDYQWLLLENGLDVELIKNKIANHLI